MLEGKIQKIDLANRSAVIAVEDGRELTVHFPDNAVIEVMELETVGMELGDLEDLDVGYQVEFEIEEHLADGSCRCVSLASIS